MVSFAFCYENNKKLNYVMEKVERFFQSRGIKIATICCHNADELVHCIRYNCPNILFYDMKVWNSSVSEAIRYTQTENRTPVSVGTRNACNHRQILKYALRAYESFLDDTDTFVYYANPDYIHIPVSEILYFISEGGYTQIISRHSKDTYNKGLNEIGRILRQKDGHFLRINKSYLINADIVSYYNRYFVVLNDGRRISLKNYRYFRMLKSDIQKYGLDITRIDNYR
jgi:hypothetical protein